MILIDRSWNGRFGDVFNGVTFDPNSILCLKKSQNLIFVGRFELKIEIFKKIHDTKSTCQKNQLHNVPPNNWVWTISRVYKKQSFSFIHFKKLCSNKNSLISQVKKYIKDFFEKANQNQKTYNNYYKQKKSFISAT